MARNFTHGVTPGQIDPTIRFLRYYLGFPGGVNRFAADDKSREKKSNANTEGLGHLFSMGVGLVVVGVVGGVVYKLNSKPDGPDRGDFDGYN